MSDADTSAEAVERAKAAYDALSPVDKALHDSDQRRSFVRGMAGDPGPDVLAEEVRRLRADRDRRAAENARMKDLLMRADEELRLIRLKDTGALYDIGLRAALSAALTGDTP